jgi:hypothetical protein
MFLLMRFSDSAVVAVAACALGAVLSAGAHAAQTTSMAASFTPERLGAATAVSLDFRIVADGRAPAGLSGVQLAYPAGLGFATSGLGVASCSPEALELVGGEACPPNSVMGSGSATVALPLGPEVVEENVRLTLFAGPSTDGFVHVLLYASGTFPVYAQVVFSGVLLPGRLNIVVPPIPSLPAAADVALEQLRLTLGGRLTYYERVNGRSVTYHPPGVGLPARCPSGGFPFVTTFTFMDGSRSTTRTAVPCPPRRAARGARKPSTP